MKATQKDLQLKKELQAQDDGRVLSVLVISDGSVMVMRNTYPYKVKREVNADLDRLTANLTECKPAKAPPSVTGVKVVRYFHGK